MSTTNTTFVDMTNGFTNYILVLISLNVEMGTNGNFIPSKKLV